MEFSDFFDTFDFIVEKILSYSGGDVISLSITCKAFYRAVSRNKKFKLRIDQNKLHDNFDAIINTGRSFDEIFLYSSKPHELYDINLEQSFEQMRKISNRFGSHMTKAKIYRAVFSSVHFTSFIQNMPKLMELHLHNVRVYDIYEQEVDVELPSDTYNSKNLSILKISECGEDFHKILPECLLRKVSFNDGISRISSAFFEQHRHIKALSLGSITGGEAEKLNNLQLQELSLFPVVGLLNSVRFRNEVLRVVAMQPTLSKLDIYGRINRPILTAICTHLKQLKSLSVDMLDNFDDLVLNLPKLTQLEELCLRSAGLDIPKLTTAQHVQIKKLFLVNLGLEFWDLMDDMDSMDEPDPIDPMSRNKIAALRRAFPSLRELGLSNYLPTNVYLLLNTFDDIETLSLSMNRSLLITELFKKTNRRYHLNFKKLFVNFHESQYDPNSKEFMDFLCSMPHLEVLEIWIAEYFDNEGLIAALKKNLLKLKKIKVFETETDLGDLSMSTSEGGDGSTVSLYMYSNRFSLHEQF